MKKKIGVLFLLLLLLAQIASASSLLTAGSAGVDVYGLQERLAELGYFAGTVSGQYEQETADAVRAFQRQNGLAETGDADIQTQQKLYSADALSAETEITSGILISSGAPVAYSGKVAYGDTGENVKLVQARLAELGYYHIEVSGNFLGNTRTAVKQFQEQNALKVDGIIGQETWQWLFGEQDVVAAGEPPRPVPYRIGVDVTNQVTTIYGLDEQGEYTIVIKHMLCSTGTEKDPTTIGTFILNGKTARWCYFPKWGTHAQYWTQIDAYNAFHSVIYAEANAMALKTGSYTGLGKRASHGCIRLMVEDAKWIYTNCGAGTEVFVYEGELDEELTKSLKIPPLDYAVMLPEPTPAPTEAPDYILSGTPDLPSRTLERGVENELVYWLQSKLTDLGYYTGTITGGYYAGTAQAVKAFQRDNGLSADGKAGRQTMQVLYEVLAAQEEAAFSAESILNIIMTVPPEGLAAPTIAPYQP